jgi:hypothetical protein
LEELQGSSFNNKTNYSLAFAVWNTSSFDRAKLKRTWCEIAKVVPHPMFLKLFAQSKASTVWKVFPEVV